MLRYAKEMEKEIVGEVSPDDFAFIKKFADKTDSAISPALLYELLSAYDAAGRAYIPALPIELALVKLFGAAR